jgi:hypothetical protein
MRHTTQLVRPDGKEIKIIVHLVALDFVTYEFRYCVDVFYKLADQKTWKEGYTKQPNEFAKLADPVSSLREYLKHVTQDEINDAKLQLWNRLHPKNSN